MTRSIYLRLRVVNESNQRDHWATKARRVKAQRHAVAYAWLVAGLPRDAKPAEVRLTRLAARRLDGDGLVRAFKAVRDEVALLCGFDDRDESVRWVYAQERETGYGVRVEVVWA